MADTMSHIIVWDLLYVKQRLLCNSEQYSNMLTRASLGLANKHASKLLFMSYRYTILELDDVPFQSAILTPL